MLGGRPFIRHLPVMARKARLYGSIPRAAFCVKQGAALWLGAFLYEAMMHHFAHLRGSGASDLQIAKAWTRAMKVSVLP